MVVHFSSSFNWFYSCSWFDISHFENGRKAWLIRVLQFYHGLPVKLSDVSKFIHFFCLKDLTNRIFLIGRQRSKVPLQEALFIASCRIANPLSKKSWITFRHVKKIAIKFQLLYGSFTGCLPWQFLAIEFDGYVSLVV